MSATLNEDFQTTVSMNGFAGDRFYPLELTPTRVTALMKLSKGDYLIDSVTDINYQGWQGIEVLVIEGSCQSEHQDHVQGGYLRQPTSQRCKATSDCILFVKFNQFLANDSGERSIDTRIAAKWLPGPVDGIDIRPLHVFDTESIMLLRWRHAAEFKPKLNPRGEEILVINGLLQHRDQLFKQYSWIRNPIEDWRRWHGNTGTLVYYKSGHFPDDPNREPNETPAAQRI